jgi:cytidylate kinase
MNPKAIIIIGPPAVGKYTIGKILSEKCGCLFLHEHQILDIASTLFVENLDEKITYYFKLRLDIFFDFIKHNKTKRSITTTFVHIFNNDYYNNFISSFLKMFQKNNYDIYVFELDASYAERIKRNTNEDRLKAKPSKQNLEDSIKKITTIEKNARTNSIKSDTLFSNCYHAIINTELLSQGEVVDRIMEVMCL